MSQALKFSKIFFSVKIASALVAGTIEVHNQIYRSENRKNALEVKMNNEAVPIPKKIVSLLDEVMNEMKLSSEERLLIKPFMTNGLELKVFGYSKIKPGAFLGIPESFYFEDYPYVVPTNFSYMIEGMEFHPNTSVSQAIKQSSFLSEDAKKFAVAREIYESRHPHIFILALVPAFVSGLILSVLLVAQRFKKSSIKRHPVGFSIFMFPFETLSFILLRNTVRIHSEGKADFEAADLGLSYMKGGVEYYEKMMERQKTLKRLSKDFPFESNGDFNTSRFRPQHMSLQRRIKYLKDLMKAGESNSKKPVVWNYVFS